MRSPNGSAGINTLTGINYMPAKKIPRKRILLNLPLWAYQEIKDRSKTSGISMTNIVLEALRQQ